MLNQPKTNLRQEIKEAEEYLKSVQEQIDSAIAIGNDVLSDLQEQISALELEKASLLKELISVRQDIDLAKKHR